MNQNLKKLFETETKKVDEWLGKLLPPESAEPVSIHKSMRYSMFAGGKRLRPVLCLLAHEICGGEGDKAYPAACALEMMHTFSLIHDDLPCMDDDDFRRGKPTNHKVFGEAIAVLAGDALCIHAYGILGSYVGLPIVKEISSALGTAGMIGGQVADIESEGTADVDAKTLEFIHIHKTEKLITTSLRTGAIIAGADEAKLAAITKYGQGIGLAFQIVDDVLDLTSDTATLGKDVGSDLENNKATYPRLYGIDKSRAEAKRLVNEAKDALALFGEKGAMLRELADFIVERVN
ncbi:MAG: polyprenyl synthetase family protein [Fibrobacteres bacterium]|nr:polyprenyl synthetase family protein [Fibrobacterota bacterium]